MTLMGLDQLWVADLTYVHLEMEFVYLAVILDAFSRRVIGWALADSPGNLDLYVWLVWRCWTAKGPVSVPLFGPEGLVSQLGISEHLRERDFRRQIVQWLKVVRQLWPHCPANVDEGGGGLVIRPVKSRPQFSTPSCESESGVHVTGFAENT
jgi:hypothetical protein